MGNLLSHSAAFPYRVQLHPSPILIDAGGLPVVNSHVVKISFLGEFIDTAIGQVNTIVDPGIAKIIVGETT